MREGVVERAGHVECVLGEIVVRPLQDRLAAFDRCIARNTFTGLFGERLRDEEGLGEEAL
ncbi:MAG: hypothetical protein H0V98_01775 [Chloroflexia bacterium]|nr:hypothetical protein [Chloroflexia bacterium]